MEIEQARPRVETEPAPGAEPTDRTRRNVLFALGGGLAGVVGAGAGSTAAAADGAPLLLGRTNLAESVTRLRTADGSTALSVRARGRSSVAVQATSPNVAVFATGGERGTGLDAVSVFGDGASGRSLFGRGVVGSSGRGFGMQGDSEESTGVVGNSRFGSAVVGANLSDERPAIVGWSQGAGTGLLGLSEQTSDELPVSPRTGVFGVGDGASAIGVRARSARGTALRVDGRSGFSRSGILTIPAGMESVLHRLEPLTAGSMVLAMLQEHEPGLHVEAATVDLGSQAFTIHVNHKVRRPTRCAWFVLD